MQILYSSNKLKNSIEDKKNREKTYGVLAKRLKMRIDALSAAISLADISHLPPPRRHKLNNPYKGCYAVDINGPFRLIFRPNDQSSTTESQINSITVLEVKNYHKK